MTDNPDNTHKPDDTGKSDTTRWAPWYVYLVAIVVANLIKQKVLADVPVVVNVAVTIVLIALVVIAITWGWRAVARR